MTPTIELARAAARAQVARKEFEDEKEYELFQKELELAGNNPEAVEMGSLMHSGVGTRLIIEMGMHVKTNKLGAVYGPDATFQIGGKDRLPDVSFLSASRFPEAGETYEKCPVAPDLAVEVISPNDVWEQVRSKIRDYFNAGVRQVWLISLEHREIYIYDSPTRIVVLTEDDELASEALLPGFRCRISELFQQPVRA